MGSVLVLLAGAAWMVTLPETMSWFAGSVWMWIGLVPLAYFGAMSFIQKKRVLLHLLQLHGLRHDPRHERSSSPRCAKFSAS